MNHKGQNEKEGCGLNGFNKAESYIPREIFLFKITKQNRNSLLTHISLTFCLFNKNIFILLRMHVFTHYSMMYNLLLDTYVSEITLQASVIFVIAKEIYGLHELPKY